MRKLMLILFIILLTAIVSCTSPDIDPEDTEDTTPAATFESEPTTPALATAPSSPLATPLPDDYPAPTPLILPTFTVNPAYPALPTLTPKYPAGESNVRVWLLRPLGIQCSDPSTYEFATLEEAVDALEAADVEVIEGELVSLPVTESCDSPTSEHFRALINASGLDIAMSLGWSPEP